MPDSSSAAVTLVTSATSEGMEMMTISVPLSLRFSVNTHAAAATIFDQACGGSQGSTGWDQEARTEETGSAKAKMAGQVAAVTKEREPGTGNFTCGK